MKDLVLPAFELDCRDWMVCLPAAIGLPEEVGGAPLLAVLSTVLIEDAQLCEVSGMMTMGLLDSDVPTRPLGAGCVASELLSVDEPASVKQYLLPSPDGQLALLAEFALPYEDAELLRRVESLMVSFRWAT